jgi:hypothetical protein
MLEGLGEGVVEIVRGAPGAAEWERGRERESEREMERGWRGGAPIKGARPACKAGDGV